MDVAPVLQNRPIPSLASAAFLVALAATAAYFAGVVPGLPKTLPTFIDLLQLTGGLLVIAAVTWAVSIALGRKD